MYNVASGPSVYPKVILEKIAKGILNYQGKEISSLELGHRSALFAEVRDQLISLTKEILEVPDDFSVLYLQGGGRLHFAQIPMNFLSENETAQFIDTGYWTSKAAEYAANYGKVEVIESSKQENYCHLTSAETSKLKGKYMQYCSNNTIYGTQFHDLPMANIPAVADMSSDIFSRTIDWSRVDLVLACAQKNFGPAGLSLLIVRNNFLATAKSDLPAVFSYKNLAAKNSNYNTPPIFNMCASLEMLKWIKENGGIEALEKRVEERASILYRAINQSDLVANTIPPEERSFMNIVFDAKDKVINEKLGHQFMAANIIGFKGHKARGGFRIGNYIGQSEEAIRAVASFL
jgi:phosphoserine aminotransferase